MILRKFIFFPLVYLLWSSSAQAVQQFQVSSDPVQIPLALDSETVVELPEPIVQVVLPRKKVPFDVMPPLGNILVLQVPESKKKQLLAKPEVYTFSVITNSRVQQIVLVPRPGIAERVKFVLASKKTDVDNLFGSTDEATIAMQEPYNRLIKKLIKALYDEIPPKGYRFAKATSDFRKTVNSKKFYYEPPQFTQDFRMDLVAVVASSKVVGRKYIISNTTDIPVHLTEPAFWADGCMAVAIRHHRLLPRTPTTERTGQYQTELYIIAQRSKAPIRNLNAGVRGGDSL